MNTAARRIQATYLTLILGNTLAASFIWGINTLFLLDAGLDNFEAFAANAFFTAGMVIFEIPTGAVADLLGRKVSYLLGTITLSGSTLLYWLLWRWHSPFFWWALVSVLLGLGFTFFSGAVEAWLVDALAAVGYDKGMERIFGRGLVVDGIAMLVGSVAGGVIAQATNLGVPFLLRAGVLAAMFVFAFAVMRDIGFTPDRTAGPVAATRRVLRASMQYGLGKRSVRFMILGAPFATGVGFYAFYALQPYLLQLYGDAKAYSIAGLAAAALALSQIAGGVIAPRARALFRRRTTSVIVAALGSAAALVLLGVNSWFGVAVVLLVAWGFMFAVAGPVRQAYLNDMIPSKQRATVLSFDSMCGSIGGVVIQPALGRTADLAGYGASLVVGGVVQLIAVPFLIASRRQQDPADTARDGVALPDAVPTPPEASAGD